MTFRAERLRGALRGPSVGGWCSLASPLVAEIVAASDVDWVGIDAQHSPVSIETVVHMVRAVDSRDKPSIVRVPSLDAGWIGRALDAGAGGVLVPMVDTVEDVRAAVAATRYQHHGGVRSSGTTRAAIGVPRAEVIDERAVCLVMLETPALLEQLDAAASVEGLDGVIVGPSDLSISLFGQLGAPDLTDVLADVVTTLGRHDVVRGIVASSVADAVRWRDLGFQAVVPVSDTGLMMTGIAGVLAAMAEGR